MKILKNILIFAVTLTFLCIMIYRIPGVGKNKPRGMPRHAEVVIHSDTLYLDSLKLPLKKIPKVAQLHKVAKVAIGRWAKLFTVLKIEESGHDGQYSVYALKYNNLVGMRYPNFRKTTAIRRGYSNYCVFDHWYDCMIDFNYYMEHTENVFVKKYQRKPKTDKEMIRFMHGSYNIYSVWYSDVFWLLDNFKYD